MPASISSIIIPHPAGNDSILRMNSGFTMSKKRNKISPHNKYVTCTGKKRSPVHIPATSSITTRAGSLPQRGSTIEEDHTPIMVIRIVMTADNATGG